MADDKMENEPVRTDRSFVTGNVNFASSYLTAANHLAEERSIGTVKLTYDAPILLLYAHSFELLLKAAAVHLGTSQEKAESYQHNLLNLYEYLRSDPVGLGWIVDLEGSVRDRWRDLLRTSRDKYQSRLESYVGPVHQNGEFGIHSNDAIGRSIPKLIHQVQWFSERHAKGGSQFRYLEPRIDQYTQISAFGLKEHVPMRSIQWASEHLIELLKSKLFPR